MRVIAGKARSLPLKAPVGLDTRPTTDRIKETLFNMLAPELPGAVFLDLYDENKGLIGRDHVNRKGKVEIFGIGAGGGKWKPITREEMIDAHTLMPDGTRIEREKGVIYTEIGNIK